ncbi:MAG: hypothetical protein HPY76_03760 [Anaerolineae bacterium]|nr:hypothetical protein [Anaerolineae bacterium]
MMNELAAIPFRYHPQILARFPQVAGAAMLGSGLANQPASSGLAAAYREEQQRVLTAIGATPLSELETLAGWRAAFRQFGVDPTQYRSAAEALLRRLTKKGDIPSISAVVDACNLVSIRYALPVAAFDLRQVAPPITVKFAGGEEIFQLLGQEQPEHPQPGEVIFIDENGHVVARRWCWRQSQGSAASLESRQVLFTIEAQHPAGRDLVARAIADLQALLQRDCGGDYMHCLLP